MKILLVLCLTLSGCILTKVPTPVVKDIACYLSPGPYHVISRLMLTSGCVKEVPPIFVQSMDVVPGQLKCGMVTAPFPNGAILIMKVTTDMVVGRLVVSDGKCHIEYSVLALPKVDKKN